MGYKFTNEILNGYNSKRNKSEATFDYGQGSIKIDDMEIAEFSSIKIHIQPILKENPLRDKGMEDEIAIDYYIRANLNISTTYSRYEMIDINSKVDIEISEGISIFECKVQDKNENNISVQIHSVKNIEIG
ncbi:hypothetical protein [Clostridium beijerinckii]|uniref:Uncharacterized protein n=1 Tax=Clostridium beijerinckii TaxID=1520 RepID=A0A1S8S9L3_CLOBE|nr:hypothetical protein [Clostridium beijerinckii]NRY59876.1 hypothetical protein [Clostridium beijerinckii]OOM62230.1 hypothetical protein CLBCK_19330 [Clostridium beijerinckii]